MSKIELAIMTKQELEDEVSRLLTKVMHLSETVYALREEVTKLKTANLQKQTFFGGGLSSAIERQAISMVDQEKRRLMNEPRNGF